MKKSLKCIIESRLNSQSDNCSYGDDLLGVMMDTKNDGPNKLKMNEIMEECKTFFFAGHETTSNWLVWTVFLLSMHKEWQEKLRQEILEICGMEIPDADMLSKLKMVIIYLDMNIIKALISFHLHCKF
jgi:PHYB activation tagged suppressor 1